MSYHLNIEKAKENSFIVIADGTVSARMSQLVAGKISYVSIKRFRVITTASHLGVWSRSIVKRVNGTQYNNIITQNMMNIEIVTFLVFAQNINVIEVMSGRGDTGAERHSIPQHHTLQ